MKLIFKAFIKSFPNYKFFLVNLFFWITLSAISAFYNQKMIIRYDRPVEWFNVWLNAFPWWINWAILAPVIIAITTIVPLKNKNYLIFLVKHIFIMLLVFSAYWIFTTVEVMVISNNDISIEQIKLAFIRLFNSPLHNELLVYMTIVCAGYALSYHNKSIQHMLQNEQLSKQLVQVELQSLKSQLNPHFLFNTLNTISSLIRLNNKTKAVKALSELSLMLRKVLENRDNQFITLNEELAFINSYLTIQKMRFEDKISIEIAIENNCLPAKIPFMLLQPLVENAVQHGSQLESNNNIKINIFKENGLLQIVLINEVSETEANNGFGIGIKNCRERMSKLYPNKFSLTLTKLSNGSFETFISLPFGELDD